VLAAVAAAAIVVAVVVADGEPGPFLASGIVV
jgi:hypothetical protein